jgi:hypothetical protein
MNAALDALRAQGYPVADDDVARLSPFALPELAGGLPDLRDPDAT